MLFWGRNSIHLIPPSISSRSSFYKEKKIYICTSEQLFWFRSSFEKWRAHHAYITISIYCSFSFLAFLLLFYKYIYFLLLWIHMNENKCIFSKRDDGHVFSLENGHGWENEKMNKEDKIQNVKSYSVLSPLLLLFPFVAWQKGKERWWAEECISHIQKFTLMSLMVMIMILYYKWHSLSFFVLQRHILMSTKSKQREQ